MSSARRDAGRLFVGIDASLDGLFEADATARRAKLSNTLFVHAAAERLPPELAGTAAALTVMLPWGSLLAAALGRDAETLAGLAGLCAPGGSFEATVSFAPGRDEAEWARLGLAPGLFETPEQIVAAYEAAGLRAFTIEELPAGALRNLPTTWAKRLASTPGRSAWRLRATIAADAPGRGVHCGPQS